MDIVFVDGSIVPLRLRAVKKKGEAINRQGQKRIRMHMAISNVINCKLFPSQRQDSKSFDELCKKWPWDKIKQVVADKGYDM